MTDPTPAPSPDEVLRFWLGDALELGWPSETRSALWFGGGAVLDQDIRRRFGAIVHQAVDGGMVAWEDRPLDRLALVLLLDQFTRNVFRGQAQAFCGDRRAQALVLGALAHGRDAGLPLAGRVFLNMPLVHAEDLGLQDEAVRRLQEIAQDAPSERKAILKDYLDSAIEHQAIIAQFGRFPHRNRVLGREDTAAEREFLLHGPRFGQ